ncbi:MAG: RsmB/NOP family class I SAM-dependent RNA methyltransferase [Candidatus Aenigmarchaeota archaeon]|nr:RsmB/NOP family class I SAM-dependent RNA methyltransferase [Candidatus Aenigmarchaeota archaeon]
MDLERYKKIIGDDYLSYFELPITAIRLNNLKLEPEIIKENLESKGYELKQIPYYKNGYYVLNDGENGKLVSKEIEHILGYIFIQDASSMIPPIVLDPKPDELILDLCAAPGAKTTQMAQMMGNSGLIIANDIGLKRIKALTSNLQRMGIMNTIVISVDGRALWKKIDFKFDKILLDVPCSASGTYNLENTKRISERLLRYLSGVQKALLKSAYNMLKEDGIMVYSTCSLEPEENEAVIDYALKNLSVELEEIKIKGIETIDGFTFWNEMQFDESLRKTKRVIKKGQEGFFIAKLRKIKS